MKVVLARMKYIPPDLAAFCTYNKIMVHTYSTYIIKNKVREGNAFCCMVRRKSRQYVHLLQTFMGYDQVCRVMGCPHFQGWICTTKAYTGTFKSVFNTQVFALKTLLNVNTCVLKTLLNVTQYTTI